LASKFAPEANKIVEHENKHLTIQNLKPHILEHIAIKEKMI
jgi:hypothetical protein